MKCTCRQGEGFRRPSGGDLQQFIMNDARDPTDRDWISRLDPYFDCTTCFFLTTAKNLHDRGAMAPKRGKSASTQRPAPDWSWVGLEDITTDAELTEEHLRKAIGLETSRPCRNKLGMAQTPVIIDLEQEDSDDQDRRSPRKDDSTDRRDEKGKGKRKSMMKGNAEEWGPQCTSVWCQDNLLCLNHLGAKAVSLSSSSDLALDR